MSRIRNKQRLFHLYRYLMENTDEEHQVTTNFLVEFLRGKDANATRKTVKDDIEVLVGEGVDVITTRSYYNSFFIGSRLFEAPEIMILADAIAANVSLTAEKKKKLIEKLLSLLSVHQAKKIREHILYPDVRGGGNEQLYYNIDKITDAIGGNKKIMIRYFDQFPADRFPAERLLVDRIQAERIQAERFPADRIQAERIQAERFPADRKRSVKGELKASGDGGWEHVLTPCAIICRNNRFYLLGYGGAETGPVVFRLDRIIKTRILAEKGDVLPNDPIPKNYLDSLFGMQTGRMQEVVLRCSNSMAEEINDRFGSSADIWKSTPESFYIKCKVSVSAAFYAWVFAHEGRVGIVSPQGVLDGYIEMVRGTLERIGAE